jgi:hypothetical protein
MQHKPDRFCNELNDDLRDKTCQVYQHATWRDSRSYNQRAYAIVIKIKKSPAFAGLCILIAQCNYLPRWLPVHCR